MKETQSDRWWEDPHFQDRLISLLIYDHETLKRVYPILTADDFRPSRGTPKGQTRWIVAERALEFFGKYQSPLGRLLRVDVLEYAHGLNLGASQVSDLKDYMTFVKTIKPSAPSAIVEKVVSFKGRILKRSALDEMSELFAAGQLTDEKWRELTDRALSSEAKRGTVVNYLETLDSRVDRRRLDSKFERIPYTFIDPLDAIVRTVGPKETGLIMAPYKRGKSLFLEWLAVAFARQHLVVQYNTLEDTKAVVEDRLDSIISAIPYKSLAKYPKTLTKRFSRFKGMIRGNIFIYDGTEITNTVDSLESAYRELRDQGIIPHVSITDYDEWLQPRVKQKEKRFEIDDVYKALGLYHRRNNLIGWVAAQTQRDTRHLKIISGDKLAEDIGKIRKVTCALSLGKGEWTNDSIYVWVAAHKNDRMEIGCEIVPDLDSMLIYDEDATRRAAKQNALDQEP